MDNQIKEEIKSYYKLYDENIYTCGREGYWSNLTKEKNKKLIESLKSISPEEAVNKYCPELKNIMFSPKRGAGLEFLETSGEEYCLDCGCMWGAISIALAKRCKYVVGMDQTLDSLRFLKSRLQQEQISNVDLVCTDLRQIPIFKNKFDIIVINGVLEWIPEVGDIELTEYFGKKRSKKYKLSPYSMQKSFLERVNNNLSSSGKLYLAIENRFDFKQFLGAKDPHANLLGVSVLPRRMSNIISQIKLGRPYVNWLYSFGSLKSLLNSSGFSKVNLYACFPDYRLPEIITSYSSTLSNFRPTIKPSSLKHKMTRVAEVFFFSYMKLKYFAPSLIAIAEK